MNAKLLIGCLFAMCPLYGALVIKIKPVKIVKYEKSTKNGAISDTTPLTFDEDTNGDPEPDYPPVDRGDDYTYEYQYEDHVNEEEDDYWYEDTTSVPSDTDELNKTVKVAPTINSVGGYLLDPLDSEASKNRTYVVPLYGNTSSYAGYMRVNEIYGVNLFFWFVVSQQNPETAPLIVWLQGQPGTSVLVGFFEEHGPYFIDAGGDIRKRKLSWTRDFNVLYLDHCVPCGFSFADDENGTTTTLESSTEYILQALTQFYAVFPEFSTNDMYLAGEYGCGKIVPTICHAIHTRNRHAERPINLKGALIGNGMVDTHEMINYGKFWYHWGMADPNIVQTFGLLEETIRGYIRSGAEDEALNYLRYHIFVKLGERDFDSPFDIRYANETLGESFMELVDEGLFRKWLHVGNATYHVGHKYLSLKLLRDISHILPELLAHYKILYYNGQFDALFPYDQTSRYLQKIGWPGLDNWYRRTRKKWYVNNQLFGYSKRYGPLTQVLIRNAGHLVGHRQPEALFHLARWFIEDLFPDSEV